MREKHSSCFLFGQRTEMVMSTEGTALGFPWGFYTMKGFPVMFSGVVSSRPRSFCWVRAVLSA